MPAREPRAAVRAHGDAHRAAKAGEAEACSRLKVGMLPLSGLKMSAMNPDAGAKACSSVPSTASAEEPACAGFIDEEAAASEGEVVLEELVSRRRGRRGAEGTRRC